LNDKSEFYNTGTDLLKFEIVKKAFNSKRKKVGTTLKSYEVELKRAHIDTNKRPEDLRIEEWINLIKLIY